MNAPQTPAVLPSYEGHFVDRSAVIVVGGGACGFCAALAARDEDADVLLLERDLEPRGTTAMSIGLIPAAGTRFQRARGIDDASDKLEFDILARNSGATDRAIVRRLTSESAATIEWLVDAHRIPLSFAETEHYAGHGLPRMHGTSDRSGTGLMLALHQAAVDAKTRIALGTTVETIFADAEGRVAGVRVVANGTRRDIACEALILASCGFAANYPMVARYIAEIAEAATYCHSGSMGDAVRWGEGLMAALADLGSYQSHGGLAVDSRLPVPWAHIMRGGIQVNALGQRFSDETRNYAQRALDVIAQPGRFAWSIYDARIDASLMEILSYRELLAASHVLTAASAEELCAVTETPQALIATLNDAAAVAAQGGTDSLGRNFRGVKPLAPPYKAVKVTGALYHTQGGLVVDGDGRVLHRDGTPFPNLFAGGGAARGISGPSCEGYLAGNGLLTATVFGRLAGRAAARQAYKTPERVSA